MGVVIRQSVKGSLAQYFGILIGYLNVLYVLPYCLDPEQNGLYRLIVETATFFALFAQVGIPNALPRFAPEFRASGKLALLEKLSLRVPLISTAAFFLLYYFFIRDAFNAEIGRKSGLYLEYEWAVVPLTLALVYSNILENLIANHYRVTVSKIVREIGLRVGLTAVCYCYFYFGLNYSAFLSLINVTYFIGMAMLLVYFYRLAKPSFKSVQFSTISKETRISLSKYLALIILSGIGTNLVNKVDIFMVSSQISLTDNAIYTTAFLITMIMDVPSRSLHQVLAPIVSGAIYESNNRQIAWAYKKSSVVQTSFAIVALVLLMLNAPWLYATMPEGDVYARGLNVIALLGLAKIFDSLTGINGLILANSKYYYVGIYFTFGLALIAIWLNNLFIPEYGLNGVAVATAISIFLYNAGLTLFVWFKFRVQPFSKLSIHLLALSLIGIVFLIIADTLSRAFLPSVILSLVFGVLSLVYIYRMRVIKELNNFLKKYRKG